MLEKSFMAELAASGRVLGLSTLSRAKSDRAFRCAKPKQGVKMAKDQNDDAESLLTCASLGRQGTGSSPASENAANDMKLTATTNDRADDNNKK